jgi:hypothetical protein
VAKSRPRLVLTGQSTQNEQIRCDLEFPRFQRELEEMESGQLERVFACIDKIGQMTWAQVLATSSKKQKRGLNWEVLDQRTTSGAVIASIRVSEKLRARVMRQGVFMRFISIHPDHDSAYKERGEENL